MHILWGLDNNTVEYMNRGRADGAVAPQIATVA